MLQKYADQYPDSGYVVHDLGQDSLRVICPLHGAFHISETNFLYFRGCGMCKGVHPRANPIRSQRGHGHPVFIKLGIGDAYEVSGNSDGHTYGVGYSDKRVAEIVAKIVDALFRERRFVDARKFMDAAYTFTPTPGSGIRTMLIKHTDLVDCPVTRESKFDPQGAADRAYPDGGYVVDVKTYKGSGAAATVKCPEHGDFYPIWRDFIGRKGCPMCYQRHHRGIPNKPHTLFIYPICDGFYAISEDRRDIHKAAFAVYQPDHLYRSGLKAKIMALCSIDGILDQAGFEAARQIMIDSSHVPECDKNKPLN